METQQVVGMERRGHWVDNGDGWLLELTCYRDLGRFDSNRRAVVTVPGYCMNTHVLGYHAGGPSMVESLCAAGLEVWTVHLRGQGASRRVSGYQHFGFEEHALVDFPAAVSYVLGHTQSRRKSLDAVGCSVGATVLYAYLVHHLDDESINSLVSIGGPLHWQGVHRLLRLAFRSPALIAALPVRGLRHWTRAIIPIVRRAPALASLYINLSLVDLDASEELVKTIDDPDPQMTREIGHWIKCGDLVVAGRNVTDELRHVNRPLMLIVANQDGIISPSSVESAMYAIDSDDVTCIRVGTPETPYSHADLFVSHEAPRLVFAPLASWLTRIGS